MVRMKVKVEGVKRKKKKKKKNRWKKLRKKFGRRGEGEKVQTVVCSSR